jgi:hypothetical protein
MSVISTTTKAKVGGKAAKAAIKNPGVLRVAAKGVKPVAKRRVKRRAVSFGDAARDFSETLITYGPQAAQELGLVEVPKPKRSLPRILIGVLIGAGAVLLLDSKNREKVASLVG